MASWDSLDDMIAFGDKGDEYVSESCFMVEYVTVLKACDSKNGEAAEANVARTAHDPTGGVQGTYLFRVSEEGDPTYVMGLYERFSLDAEGSRYGLKDAHRAFAARFLAS